MADKKISQLTALSAANLAPSTDVLAIVDTSATETKKIVAQDLVNGVLNVASAVGIGTSSPATKLDIVLDDATTNTVANVLTLTKTTSGTAASGIGAGVIFKSERASGGVILNRAAIYGVAGTNVDDDGDMTFYTLTDTGGSGFSEKMRLDSSGSLGLGVTPSAWSGATALQVNNSLSLWSQASGAARYAQNVFFDGSVRKYVYTGTATEYEQGGGAHAWKTAASGTAGNAISFTQALTLDASGNLLVGVTSAPNGGSARDVVLHNTNSASTYLKISNASTGAAPSDGFDLIMGTASDAYAYNRENGPLIFGTNNTERARITAAGSVVAGGSVALATTATDGFLYVPTCAGTPTGTPTAITGMAPIVVNTTNNKLYFYSGGAWRDAGP